MPGLQTSSTDIGNEAQTIAHQYVASTKKGSTVPQDMGFNTGPYVQGYVCMYSKSVGTLLHWFCQRITEEEWYEKQSTT
jgi:hypothetical protein